jgi:phage terminase large subunit-like protein
VYESNFGGAMVEVVVKAAASEAKLRVNLKEVRASRGKVVRAEPVAALYEQGKVHHVGGFPSLEDQLCAFTTNGYMGDGSPDRADALIWGLTEIFPRVVSRGDGDWRNTRPHRDRPKWANVGYSHMKAPHFRRGSYGGRS